MKKNGSEVKNKGVFRLKIPFEMKSYLTPDTDTTTWCWFHMHYVVNRNHRHNYQKVLYIMFSKAAKLYGKCKKKKDLNSASSEFSSFLFGLASFFSALKSVCGPFAKRITGFGRSSFKAAAFAKKTKEEMGRKSVSFAVFKNICMYAVQRVVRRNIPLNIILR